MTKTIEIGDTTVEPAGIEEYDETHSVKLFGPPGSGKTTNATARVGLLLRDQGYTIADVCWLTYRKSLAMDTLNRLADAGVVEDKQTQDPTEGATRYIGTAHAVANRSVAGSGEVVEYNDKIRFCKSRNIQFEKSEPWDRPPGRQLFGIFAYARKNLLDPTDKSDLRQIPAYRELKENWSGNVPSIYEDWLAFKDREDKIMFWEQLAAPLRENVRPNKPVLVIDEYHDAYPLLAKLSEYWAENAEIVIAAGDPHQVVNTYDGADPGFYHRLEYPEVKLPIAWDRPPHEHWHVAKAILSNAHTPPDLDIRNTGRFEVAKSPAFDRKAEEWDTPDPKTRHSPAWFVHEHGTNTMLLTRTKFQLDALAASMEKAGLLFETPTSSDVPGWQAAANEDLSDRVAMYNALQKIRRVTPDCFEDTTHGLDSYTDSDAVDPSRIPLAPKEAAILLDHADSNHLAESRGDTSDTLKSWLVAEEAKTADELNDHVTTGFWGTYTQSARSVNSLNKTGPVTNSTFDDRARTALTNALRVNDYPVEGSPETKLYTIHAAKGNQAETVVVYDGMTNRVKEAMNGADKEQRNEWRTWYVALTRSTDKLYVLKDGFDFTTPALPRGGKLLELAQRGHEAGRQQGGTA